MAATHETHPTARTYLIIWAWLAGLMLTGVFLGQLPIKKSTVVLAVLILSSIKATLVGMYYMHLKLDRRFLALIAVGPIVLLLLVIGLLFSSRLVHL